MKIEYLIIVKQDNTFCNTKEAFLNFLQVDSSIKIIGDAIQFSYQNESHKFGAKFSIQTEEISSKNERYFHLILNSDKEDAEQQFSALANTIREIASRINPGSTRIDTLWDDIGRQYAIQAYPLINEVENLMRKLISKFMLAKVGMDWSKEAIHSEILDKIERRNDKQDSYLDVLYKTDFIHLSDILFKKYRILNINELDKILLSESFSEETFERIKEILPRSNWERHFSKIIKYDENKLKSKWELLYSLRNDIAHNRYISQANFSKIKGLVTDIKQVLIQTINELDKIDLTEGDKKNVLISYQSGSIAAQYYLTEKAVVEWYLEKYVAVNLQTQSIPKFCDFVVQCEDNWNIAVDIKSPSAKGIHYLFGFINDQIIDRASAIIINNQISEFHIVIVVPGLMDGDLESQKIIYKTKDLQQRITNSQIKLIVGYLDDENRFVAIDV